MSLTDLTGYIDVVIPYFLGFYLFLYVVGNVVEFLSRLFPPAEPNCPATSTQPRRRNIRAGDQNVVSYYRTQDGKADYRFSFEEIDHNQWRVYILEQPSYGSRSSGSLETHRLRDGKRTSICVTKTITSLHEARRLASLWADCTQKYIRQGSKF